MQTTKAAPTKAVNNKLNLTTKTNNMQTTKKVNSKPAKAKKVNSKPAKAKAAPKAASKPASKKAAPKAAPKAASKPASKKVLINGTKTATLLKNPTLAQSLSLNIKSTNLRQSLPANSVTSYVTNKSIFNTTITTIKKGLTKNNKTFLVNSNSSKIAINLVKGQSTLFAIKNNKLTFIAHISNKGSIRTNTRNLWRAFGRLQTAINLKPAKAKTVKK